MITIQAIVTQVDETIDPSARDYNRSVVTLHTDGQYDEQRQNTVPPFEVKLPVRYRQGEPRPFRVGEKYLLQLNRVQEEENN